MFFIHRPSDETIRKLLAKARLQVFSFRLLNFQNEHFPRGYNVDHNRTKLGAGPVVFSRGAEAIKQWEMFNIGWVELCWPGAPIETGSTVAVLASHFGLWSLNACRIVNVIDEDGPVRRYGFIYGTLPEHAERGEERFTVEWRKEDDSVWYDILAYSRPNQFLSKVGYPIGRMLQKRFARDSMAAMVRSVRRVEGEGEPRSKSV
jgi:uncharacterized protein (UPF0548 family)